MPFTPQTLRDYADAAIVDNTSKAISPLDVRDGFKTAADVIAAETAARQAALEAEATARANALAEKAPKNNPTFTGTVSGVTKTHVGLDKVDNTPDAEKPVSGPQDAAIGEVRSTVAEEARRTQGFENAPGSSVSVTDTDRMLTGVNFRAAIADGSGSAALAIGEDGATYVKRIVPVNGITGRTFEVPRETSQHAWAIGDGEDNVAMAVTQGGDVLLPGGVVSGNGSDWQFVIIDELGFVGFGVRDGMAYGNFPQQASSYLSSADARNRDYAASVALTEITAVQPLVTDYASLIVYGQSLGEGVEAWPSLSKTALPHTLMIGENVDCLTAGGTYTTVGSPVLNPLVSATNDGTVNLTGEQEALLAPGSQNRSEAPVIGFTRDLSRAAGRRGIVKDIIAMSPAVGGRAIATLNKGNGSYATVIDGVSKAHTLAGGDHAVVAMGWVQGEQDYNDGTTRSTYAGALSDMFDDFVADISAVTGQSNGPLFLTYQTGAAFANDSANLAVAMAQLDVAMARDDTVMFGPAYPYTDKSFHLDANGSRWMGAMMAKVARRVLLDGKGWQPLRPIEIVATGATVDIHFHVPVAPLVFDTPYVISAPTNYADKGFRVTGADGTTAIAVTSVEIVAGTVVRLTLAAEPPADALVWYADKTSHNGNGNLRDSDPAVSGDIYEYVPERGMYAAANIAALVGKPYPLHNWSVAFCLPITYSEF